MGSSPLDAAFSSSAQAAAAFRRIIESIRLTFAALTYLLRPRSSVPGLLRARPCVSRLFYGGGGWVLPSPWRTFPQRRTTPRATLRGAQAAHPTPNHVWLCKLQVVDGWCGPVLPTEADRVRSRSHDRLERSPERSLERLCSRRAHRSDSGVSPGIAPTRATPPDSPVRAPRHRLRTRPALGEELFGSSEEQLARGGPRFQRPETERDQRLEWSQTFARFQR